MKLKLNSLIAALGLLAMLSGNAHAQATTDSFAGWTKLGDAVSANGTITLTTAFMDGDGDQAYNLSGESAVDVLFGGLADQAGVDVSAFDIQDQFALEGSLITQSFSALAGQTLSFDWSFATHEDLFLDNAFVVIGGQVVTLATAAQPGSGTQSYSYTFAQSGPVALSFGVVDTDSSFGVSLLSVSNLQLTSVAAVPEPTTTALMFAGLALVVGLKRAGRGGAGPRGRAR